MSFSSLTMRPMSGELASDGPFEDIVLISSNARSNVYRASRGGKYCFLKAPSADKGMLIAMIQREWEFGQDLNHTGIVNMLSYEESSPVGPCIVMEYIDGRTLSTFLAEEPSFAERRKVFRRILEAVQYLHGKGIVHNDLKPDNILVRNVDNNAVIIDFGLSDDDAHYLTKGMGGTPGYASPELCAGETVDARSDIWSLGVIMKDMFGKRYSRISGKCLREDKNRRYGSVEKLSSSWNSYYKVIFASALILFLVIGYIAANIPYKSLYEQFVENHHTFVVNPDLSAEGTANCYIVPAGGEYSFDASLKGGVSAVVLWESFCTDKPIAKGDLISDARLLDGRIHFHATGTNGNAVIALLDESDNILWSWHLWCCRGYEADYFAQKYRNGAGILMDRNLGATSAVPGKVESFGLYYQWGRKDPFLGSANPVSLINCSVACERPFSIELDTLLQTYGNSIANPTVFFARPTRYDYHTDGLEWSDEKNANDPCPPGWKVVKGGRDGFWAKAFADMDNFDRRDLLDTLHHGIDLKPIVGASRSCLDCYWFPFAGVLSCSSGNAIKIGSNTRIWTSTPDAGFPRKASNRLSVTGQGFIDYLSSNVTHATAISVRCCKIEK